MKEILLEMDLLMEKFPGKGGWTYVQIPHAVENKKVFGWQEVDVDIDGYEILNYKLMPMGKGRLFLPVKAEIRKKIKKEVGATVHVKIYIEPELQVSDDDVMMCLQDEPLAYDVYMNCTQQQQKAFLDWVNAAKNEDDKVERIAEMISNLSQNRTNVSRW